MNLESSVFLSPSEERSFVLIIEGQNVYVSKETLAIYSPVFKKMFYGNFKEADENCVKLPDKKLTDVVELLQCLLPYPSKSEIDENNVNLMLTFADEYDIYDLKNRCENFLLTIIEKFNSSASNETDILNMLHLASNYQLKKLLKICIKRAASLRSSLFKERRRDFPINVIAAVFEAKLNRVELQSHELSDRRKDPFFCSCRYCNATPSTRCIRCKFGICATCVTKYHCTGFHSQECPNKLDGAPPTAANGGAAHESFNNEFKEYDCLCGYDYDDTCLV